ncbi:MAG: hypothetical protein ACLP7Q_10275 [Isosphaeraceae bacterium]
MGRKISGDRGDERKELERFLGSQSLDDLAKGIKSQPRDLGLEADPAHEREIRNQNPKDEDYQAKLWEYHNRLTEDYQATLKQYHLKLVAHIILASTVGRSTDEIRRELNSIGIMLCYNVIDEMIFRWRAALAQSWPDDLGERLGGIAEAGPGSLRDRRNDVECTLLSGRKKTISLDKLVESGEVWYGSLDVSPHEVLYRSQYGEWILVSEPIHWGTGEYSIEARELTSAQSHAWFCENQIDLPDLLKGVDSPQPATAGASQARSPGFLINEAAPPEGDREPTEALADPVTLNQAADCKPEKKEQPAPTLDPLDENSLADALLAKGFTIEAAFVRHFKGRQVTTWQEIVEAVCPGEEREWGTVKTWTIRVKNALADVAPRCRLTFSTSQREFKVIKKTLPE